MVFIGVTGCVSQDQADSLAGSISGGSSGSTGSGATSSSAQALLIASPSSLAFGSVAVGSSSAITLTILDAGGRNAQIDSLTLTVSAFSTTTDLCTATTLTTSSTCTMTVRYEPSATGAQAGTFRLAYHDENGSYSLAIPMTGTGAVATPQLQSSPSSYNYGSITIGSIADEAYVISNANSIGAIMDSASVTGTGFSVQTDGCIGNTLDSTSASCSVTVRFSPLVQGSVLGLLTLNYHTSDLTAYTLQVSLSGVGAGAVPDLSFSENPYSFGNVATNARSTHIFTVTNYTSVNANLGISLISGLGFSISSQTCNNVVLTPAGTCTLSVAFQPTSVTGYTGTVTIPFTSTTGASYSKSISVSGNGVTPTTSFLFSGFTGDPTTDEIPSSLTGTSVGLRWSAQSLAAYYRITRTGGADGTVISSPLTPTTVSTYTAQFLVPNTAYQFKVNAYDLLDISDGNNNWVTITTPNVYDPSYVATFGGWSDAIATGNVFTDVGLLDTALGKTGTARAERNLGALAGFGGTDVDIANDTITVNLDFATGTKFTYRSDGTEAAPLVSGNTYYAIRVNATTIKLAATAADATTGTPINLSSQGSGNMTLMPTQVVKLGWEAFTTDPIGTSVSGYRIYRALSAGGAYTQVGHSSTQTFSDWEVSPETYYYYRITPEVAGVEITPQTASDSVIQIYVPPENMALMHRWIVNREMCTGLLGFSWPSGVDRDDQYSCNYTWGAGFAPQVSASAKAKWDIGYSMLVNRWSNGCHVSPTGPMYVTTNSAPTATAGSVGNVSYIMPLNTAYSGSAYQYGRCFYKRVDGWVSASSLELVSLQDNMITNMPGYPTFKVTQDAGALACKAYASGAPHNPIPTDVTDGNGNISLRLFRAYELNAAKIIPGVRLNSLSATDLAQVQSGANLPVYGGCNANVAGNKLDGVSSSPLDPGVSQWGDRLPWNGSRLVRNCKSRYDVEDLWLSSTVYYWASDQTINDGVNRFRTSALDAGNVQLENYSFDDTLGKSSGILTHYNATYPVIPLFGIVAASESSGIGSMTVSSWPATWRTTGSTSFTVGGILWNPLFRFGMTAMGGSNESSPGNVGGIYTSRCVGQVGP